MFFFLYKGHFINKIKKLMYLLLVGQTGQRSAGLPVSNDPPRILVRWEEAHDPAWDHVTNVGENASRLIHLSTNRHICAVLLL